MHSFLKSIGFSNIDTKQKEEELIDEIMRSSDKKCMISLSEQSKTQYVEVSKEFSKDLGITVRGQQDEEGNFRMDHYFPYLISHVESSREEMYIGKKSDSDAYAVLCDEMRLGVSLIFFLQNAVDYMRFAEKGNDDYYQVARLSALASEGTILFPTMKSVQDVEDSKEENVRHKAMLLAAKHGDQDAIDRLTMKEIDTVSAISKRIRNEDVFSIVDTSFAPFGMESEVYKIVGIILALNERTNSATGENVYVMEIYCNHMVLELCINAENLMGEPAVGRRFRGIIWLQGSVNYELKENIYV